MGVRVDEAWRDQGTVQADDVVDAIRRCVVVRADPGDPSVQHHERLGRTVDPCVHNTAAVDRPHGATVAQRRPERAGLARARVSPPDGAGFTAAPQTALWATTPRRTCCTARRAVARVAGAGAAPESWSSRSITCLHHLTKSPAARSVPWSTVPRERPEAHRWIGPTRPRSGARVAGTPLLTSRSASRDHARWVASSARANRPSVPPSLLWCSSHAARTAGRPRRSPAAPSDDWPARWTPPNGRGPGWRTWKSAGGSRPPGRPTWVWSARSTDGPPDAPSAPCSKART